MCGSSVSHVIYKQPVRIEVVVVLQVPIDILAEELTDARIKEGKDQEQTERPSLAPVFLGSWSRSP
jgi:hypothetical protein